MAAGLDALGDGPVDPGALLAAMEHEARML